MIRLMLVRHGQTSWNAQRRYQGISDIPLNETGIEQARRLAARLQPEEIDLIYCSDLLRARETAEILSQGRQPQPSMDARLRELNFGVLEGLTFDEGRARWPEMIDAWVQDFNRPPTGGERMDDFSARVLDFLAGLRQTSDGKTVLVVAHGGPLREIIQELLGRPANPPVWFNLEHGSLSELQFDAERVIINHLNDCGHLR